MLGVVSLLERGGMRRKGRGRGRGYEGDGRQREER